MNVHEKIEKLETELAELKRQVEIERQNKKQFKQGDWVVIREDTANPVRITRTDGFGNFPLEVTFLDGGVGAWRLDETIRHATKEEVETAIRDEWDRRCKEAGWDNGDEAHIENQSNDQEYDRYYDSGGDELWTCNGKVYEKGKWAVPKPKQSKIIINGYEAEFNDGFVKFGCAEIDFDLFDELDDLIQGHWKGNRFIESVTIGQGTFTKEDISLITKHGRS